MSLGTVALILGVVACLHLGLWALKNPATTAAPVEDRLASVSYNRFAGAPSAGLTVPEARIRADLTAIAGQARAVRTYASTQGLERVPEIAAELGLTVTLGIWIDNDNARNEREIQSALDLARHNPNVTRLVVGNETVFRHERSVADLIRIIQRVKRDSPVPVATAENWQTFIQHPELGDAVDQIFAHIIPYWEGGPKASAVGWSLAIYDRLRAAFPGKTIVIGELGWPSAGRNYEQSMPGSITQAVVLRDFVARAMALSTTISSRRSISRRNCSRAMSVLIGASSTHPCGPNLPGPGRWSMPNTGRRRRAPSSSACCCHSLFCCSPERRSDR